MPKLERIAPSRVIKNPYHYAEETPKVRVRAAKLLHGALDSEDVGYNWARPLRFLPEQYQALASCQAWYPGIFRQMALCSAGISVEFETDCSFVNIEVRPEAAPRATQNVLEQMRGDKPEVADAFVIELDGQIVRTVPLGEPGQAMTLKVDIAALVEGREEQDAESLQLLPMLETTHTVRVWLPCLRGCELGNVYGDGSFIRPCAKRAELLVLGDSIAQGFCATNPSETWPCIVARANNYDLVNQSVGAQVFQYSSLAGLSELDRDLNPSIVVVALGTNYRYGACGERIVERDIFLYLQGVDALWPEAQLVVLVPNVETHTAVKHSCYKQVPSIIEKVALGVRAKRLAEGRPALLISYAPALPEALRYDEDVHPTSEGHAFMAEFMLTELKKLECRCLQQYGKYGQCGSCVTLEVELEVETALDDVAVENNVDDAELDEEDHIEVARLVRLTSGTDTDLLSDTDAVSESDTDTDGA